MPLLRLTSRSGQECCVKSALALGCEAHFGGCRLVNNSLLSIPGGQKPYQSIELISMGSWCLSPLLSCAGFGRLHDNWGHSVGDQPDHSRARATGRGAALVPQ